MLWDESTWLHDGFPCQTNWFLSDSRNTFFPCRHGYEMTFPSCCFRDEENSSSSSEDESFWERASARQTATTSRSNSAAAHSGAATRTSSAAASISLAPRRNAGQAEPARRASSSGAATAVKVAPVTPSFSKPANRTEALQSRIAQLQARRQRLTASASSKQAASSVATRAPGSGSDFAFDSSPSRSQRPSFTPNHNVSPVQVMVVGALLNGLLHFWLHDAFMS